MITCYTEDHEFNGSVSVSTTTSNFDSNFARCSLTGNSTAVTDVFTFGESTNVNVSFRAYTGSTVSAYYGLNIVAESSYKGIYTKLYSGKMYVYGYNGSAYTLLASESSSSFTSSAVKKIDIELSNLGSSGNIKVYASGVLIIDYTGDLSSYIGTSGLGRVNIQGGTFFGNFSEIVVSNGEAIRSKRVKSLSVDGAGDSNSFTNDYTSVDEVALSDTDFMYSNTVGAEAQLSVIGMPTGTFNINAVKVSARAMKTSDSTPTKLAIGVKTNSTISAGSEKSLSSDIFAPVSNVLSLNPVTGSSWTPSEVNALQINLKTAA